MSHSAPHEDEPGKLKWQLEGTFLSTAPLSSGTTSGGNKKARPETSSGSFFLEATGPIPPSAFHSYGFKRRSLGGLSPGVAAALLLPSVPRDLELVWEELPLSSQSASSLRVPLLINGGLISGSSASLVDSSSSLLDGRPFMVSGYIDEDAAAASVGGPFFEFVVQYTNDEERIIFKGRVAVEHEGRATGDLDYHALRLCGTRAHIDQARGIFEFQGSFTLRVPGLPSVSPSSAPSQKRQTAGSVTPTRPSSPKQPVLAPPTQEDAEPTCAKAIAEEAAAEMEAQHARDLAKEETRAKADADAAAAAEAAVAAEQAAEASRMKAEAERVASARASTPPVPSAQRAMRPEDALAAKQEDIMRLKAAADAKAAALAIDRQHEHQQHQAELAARRKATLEAESLRRREAMQAEAQRLRALADASQAQLERSRALRLASIETNRAAIAAARLEEETWGRNPQTAADAERRKAGSRAKGAGRSQHSVLDSDDDSQEIGIGNFGQRVGPTHHAGVAVFHRPTAAELAAAAAAEEARQMSPVRLRAPPPPLFDYLKNHTETGILPHVFDLLSVAAPPPLSVDYALRDVLQASAASAQPLTPGALLPLTLLFGPDGLPDAAYHTDTHGCIRRNEWSTLDPRSIFLKFERNVTLQRAALASAVMAAGGPQATSVAASSKGGQPEEELAATLLVLDGTLPTLALSLLDVGVLLKNGLSAVRSIPAVYSNTSQGFIVQSMVFPSMQTPSVTSSAGVAPSLSPAGSKSALHVPHLSVYRVDFSSAHHLEVEKRTNRYALYACSNLPGHSQASSGSSAVTTHMRVATYKSPEAERLIHSEMLSGRGSESVANRETFALLRRICVAILKRVNDKCRAEEGAHTNIGQAQKAAKLMHAATCLIPPLDCSCIVL